MYVCMYAHTHTHTHKSIDMYMYTHTHTHTQTHTYTHTHTHTHITVPHGATAAVAQPPLPVNHTTNPLHHPQSVTPPPFPRPYPRLPHACLEGSATPPPRPPLLLSPLPSPHVPPPPYLASRRVSSAHLLLPRCALQRAAPRPVARTRLIRLCFFLGPF